MRHAVLFAITALLLVPQSLFAASIADLTLTPAYPKPGESVTVTARVKQGSAATIPFRWTVNGAVVSSGLGNNSISTDAPSIGAEKVVTVLIGVGVNAESVTTTIRPASVTLLWEAKTSVPPLYIGRALPTANATIVFNAIPDMRTANQDIAYTWKVNGATKLAQSGYGKSTFTTKPPLYNQPFTVSVVAESRSGALTASDSVRITPTKPTVAVYEVRPLEGILFNSAVLGTYPFTNSEVSFIAYPLHAANRNELTPTWKLNGSVFTLTGNPWQSVFRKEGSGNGSYTVDVEVAHPTDFLAQAASQFLLQF